MDLTVLVDNNTFIDDYFLAEPAVSYYLETEGLKILFDVGYSEVFYKNALKLNINLKQLDYVVISHGHLDHIWGLEFLKNIYSKQSNRREFIKPKFIAHPYALLPKLIDNEHIGCKLSREQISETFKLQLTKTPVWLTENLVFLGEIERQNHFEGKYPLGKFMKDGVLQDDYLMDDSALVYKAKEGLVIITGCSHAGIGNIIAYAKKICKTTKIVDIIGGFHLLEPKQQDLEELVNYFSLENIRQIHPCHCTDLSSKIALSKCMSLKEVGVGLKISY